MTGYLSAGFLVKLEDRMTHWRASFHEVISFQKNNQAREWIEIGPFLLLLPAR